MERIKEHKEVNEIKLKKAVEKQRVIEENKNNTVDKVQRAIDALSKGRVGLEIMDPRRYVSGEMLHRARLSDIVEYA